MWMLGELCKLACRSTVPYLSGCVHHVVSEISSLLGEAGSCTKEVPLGFQTGLSKRSDVSHSPVLDPSARVCVYMSGCEPLHGSRGRAKRPPAYVLLIYCSLLPLYYSYVQPIWSISVFCLRPTSLIPLSPPCMTGSCVLGKVLCCPVQ